jgi:hypothetical protein
MTSALLVRMEGTGCDVPYLPRYKKTLLHYLQCRGKYVYRIPLKSVPDYKATPQFFR